ncbi:hypothetical protein [Inquilinus ginsengisoli]|uniref:hypothetical protein n=1 Tax=Inquilinus ginsengisoli TaxID=363840 RepID=UPI003D23EB43
MSTAAPATVDKPAHAERDRLNALMADVKGQVEAKQAELAGLDLAQTAARVARRRAIADLHSELEEIQVRLDGLQPAIGAEIAAEQYHRKVAQFEQALALQDERRAAASEIDDALAVLIDRYDRMKRLAREIHTLTGVGDELLVEVRRPVRDEIIMTLIPAGILSHDDIPSAYGGLVHAFENVFSCEQAAEELGAKIRDRWPVTPVRQAAEEAAYQAMAEKQIAAVAEQKRRNELAAMAPYMLPADTEPPPRQQLNRHAAPALTIDIGLPQDGDR